MKIGIVGVGNIATKAYLPVYAPMQDKFEFVICSRDAAKAQRVAAQYGFSDGVCGVDALIQAGVGAVFVHTATCAHFDTAKTLLRAGIPVCMDKPISQSLEQTRALIRIAQQHDVVFMSGFNRRFAPMTDRLKALPNKNMIFISKNRISGKREPRRLIYDEFIHPLDTAVYLLDDGISTFQSRIVLDGDGLLVRALATIQTPSATVIVSSNRESGANLEMYEVQTPNGTYKVENLSTLTTISRDGKRVETFPDWTPTLEKRGFVPMIHAFIDRVTGLNADIKQQHVLLSHELCEQMLEDL